MHHQRLILICAALFPSACGAYVSEPIAEMAGAGASADASGHALGTSSAAGGASATPLDELQLPCDLLERGGHPCVAAHSTVRLLSRSYGGPLYEVCQGDVVPGLEACKGEPLAVYPREDGLADVAALEAMCLGATCTITIIFDQAGNENHLTLSPPGSGFPGYSRPASSQKLPVQVGGRTAYGVLLEPGNGYRAGCVDCEFPAALGAGNVPVGDAAQTVYMITSAIDASDGCCFNYGNGSRSQGEEGRGSTEALYFGRNTGWRQGGGEGPWVMADLDEGLFPGWDDDSPERYLGNTSVFHDFVTAVLVGDTADKNGGRGRFALYAGDAQQGQLQTMYDGSRPSLSGYVPMRKKGSVLLGTSSQNLNQGSGRFYEGVIATGAASKQTLDALQAAIVAVKYGQ